MQKEDLVTAKFRVQLPSMLQPVSPALAAFHSTRARLLLHPGPETDVLRATNCTKCGAYLLDGTGSIRTVRKALRGKRKSAKGTRPYVRVLHRTCGMCGCDEDLPLEKTDLTAQHATQRSAAALVRTSPGPQGQTKIDSARPSPAHTPIAAPSRPSSLAPSRQLSQTPTAALSCQPSRAPVSALAPPLSSDPSSKASTSFKLSPALARGAADARTRSRPKKQTGLQDMLARNRERQEQEKKAAGGGLAAFLQEL